MRVPGDVAALDEDLAAGRAALEQARTAEKVAEDADRKAREALADSPQRAPLERARERRTERGECLARLPALEAEVARLSARSGQAEKTVHDASAGLEQLRGRQDADARGAEAADRRVADLSAEHAVLAAVTVPDGTGQLDERRQAAADTAREASAALRQAEQADTEARAARDSAVPPGPLEQARRDLRDLADLIASAAPARARLDQARDQRASADTALEAAEAAGRQRQQDVDAARRAHVVADLRPHLILGQACPVCEQPVGTLPAPQHAPAIDDAQQRLDEAMKAAAAARSTVKDAAAAEARAASELDALAGERTRRIRSLTAALAGPLAGASLTITAGLLGHESESAPAAAAAEAAARMDEAQARRAPDALAEIGASLRARQGIEDAANAAAVAVDAGRARARSAQAALEEAETRMAAARDALHAGRDPLVGLGAPPVDDVTLAAAWTRLATWAAGQAHARAAGLAEARQAAQAAAGQLSKTQADFGQAEADLARLRTDSTGAARAEQQARTRLTELTARIDELGQLLQGAPDEDQITAQLALRDKLEAAASDAEQRLLKDRAGRTDAQHAMTGLEQAESAARARLSAARDPVVRLGAPPALGDTGIRAAWTALVTWSAREASARDEDITVRAGPGRHGPRERGAAHRPAERGTGGRRNRAGPGRGRRGRIRGGGRGGRAGPGRDHAHRGTPRPGHRPDRPAGCRAGRAAGGQDAG